MIESVQPTDTRGLDKAGVVLVEQTVTYID